MVAHSLRFMLHSEETRQNMIFQFLTAASMKITAFWDIAPCGLVVVERRFRDAYCLRHLGDLIHRPDDGVSTQTTRRNIPEDSNIHAKIYSM